MQQQQFHSAFPPNPYGPGYVTYPPPSSQQQEALRVFWQQQIEEVLTMPSDPTLFKNHQLPLARIKKVCCDALT